MLKIKKFGVNYDAGEMWFVAMSRVRIPRVFQHSVTFEVILGRFWICEPVLCCVG